MVSKGKSKMKAEGVVKQFQILEKTRGERRFYKVAFLLVPEDSGDGKTPEFPCYFWSDNQDVVNLENKRVQLQVLKIAKNQLFVKVEKIVETQVASTKPVVIINKGE